MEIIGEAGGGAVTITCDGQGKFKSIKLKPEAINPENPSSVDNDTIESIKYFDVDTQLSISSVDEIRLFLSIPSTAPHFAAVI